MPESTLEYRTLPGLWQEYAVKERLFAFRAASAGEARTWQENLRARLVELLGISLEPVCDLAPQILDVRQGDGFTCQLVAIQTAPGEFMPCRVLIPAGKTGAPFKPVIALHGHGTWGGQAIVEAPDDPLGAALNRQLNYDYAGQLARRGYLVFAPELRGFGMRLEEPEYREGADAQWISSCYAVSVNALLLGKTLAGLRVYDIMRLVDYIAARSDAESASLGCVGLSGGGMVTLFTAALDPRITCAVVSGYFNTFRDSIMALRHCLCNFVPGILNYAEMEDIAGLVAPRPLLVESGLRDPIFPNHATRQAYTGLHKVYSVFGATGNLDIDIFDGEHAWSGAKAYDFLAKFLST